jgi:hypothetical protein
MTPLAAKLVFITSSAFGAATLGTTAYLVEHPRAFAPEPVRPLPVTPLAARPLPPAPVVVTEAVELTPVVIKGTRAPLIPKAPTHKVERAPKTENVKTFAPCTEWRDMGPTNTKKGGEAGTRRVRTLC